MIGAFIAGCRVTKAPNARIKIGNANINRKTKKKTNKECERKRTKDKAPKTNELNCRLAEDLSEWKILLMVYAP